MFKSRQENSCLQSKVKVADLVKSMYERLGKFRQLVGWTAVSMSTVINSCQKKPLQQDHDSNIPIGLFYRLYFIF